MRFHYLHGMPSGLRRQGRPMLTRLYTWLTSPETWSNVGHNLIAGFITMAIVGIPTGILMAWDYMAGQSGPWIVALGIFVGTSMLWLRQQIVAILDKRKPQPIAVDDSAALAAKRKAEKEEEQNRRCERRRLIELAVIQEEKEAMKKQLELAPAKFDSPTAIAWFDGTKHLIQGLSHVVQINTPLFKSMGLEQQQQAFEKAIVEVRIRLVHLAEEEAKLRH
jgi:hypothetical protein